MSYINSENLKVFPTAHTRPTQLSSRMLYEKNIANIIGQLIDTNGFIIQFPSNLQSNADSISIAKGSTSLIFNLEGYYFTILPGASFDKPDGEDKYLIAYLNSNNLNNSLDQDEWISELKQDSEDSPAKFEGLSFESVSNLSTINHPYIILYKSVEDSSSSDPDAYIWQDYTDSLAKFGLSSLSITGIDGKYQ